MAIEDKVATDVEAEKVNRAQSGPFRGPDGRYAKRDVLPANFIEAIAALTKSTNIANQIFLC